MKLWTFVCLSFVVHALQFACIFDIYFKSPVVHGIKDHKPNVNAPASRLVLFSADGLRADKFFELDENGETRAPYLRNILQTEGTWGISHDKAPTETRPCHVSMIAGFDEDPSGLFIGFKENPVKFDTIFNKSTATWAWGSDDVIPQLAEMAGPHVQYACFPIGYGSHDFSLRDEWVFEKVERFFVQAKKDGRLKEQLLNNGIVFFLHLLGIDENGHRHSPLSTQYLSNIKSVDKGVQRMVNLIEDFYDNDGRTSYIFTSDHGHLDIGGHGGNHFSETESPFVMWGAGATQHTKFNAQLGSFQTERTMSWQLDPSYRADLNQVDKPALMASLLALPVPVNSNGILPVHYLGIDMERKCKLLLSNAKQMAEQFLVKRRQTKENAWALWPFWSLGERDVADFDAKITKSISHKNYQRALKLSSELIELSKSGFTYYHTYQKVVLSRSVTLTYVGWILIALCIILNDTSSIKNQILMHKKMKIYNSNSTVFKIYASFSIWVFLSLVACNVSVVSYAYSLLPIPIFYYITLHLHVFRAAWVVLWYNRNVLYASALYILLGIVGAFTLVAGFYHRYVLSVQLLIAAAGFMKLKISKFKFYAAALCVALAAFPILRLPEEGHSTAVAVVTTFATSLACFLANRYLKHKIWRALPILLLVVGVIRLVVAHRMLGLGFKATLIHALSWSILTSGWIVPLLQSTKVAPRMLCIFLCHCAMYLLLCLSHEGTFCVLLCALMVVWACVECQLSKLGNGGKRPSLEGLDFTEIHLELGNTPHQESFLLKAARCYLLTLCLVLALFGVGNINLINRFDSRSVLPFVHGGPVAELFLRVYKLIFPTFMVVCGFGAVIRASGMKFGHAFCIMTAITDIMNVTCFYTVCEFDGSWLDTGTSIRNHAFIAFSSFIFCAFHIVSKFLATYKCAFK